MTCVFIALWYDKSRQIIFYFRKFCTYCLWPSDMRWSRVTFDVNSIDAKFDWDCVKSALSKINYFHILLLRRINLEKIFQIVKTGNIYLPFVFEIESFTQDMVMRNILRQIYRARNLPDFDASYLFDFVKDWKKKCLYKPNLVYFLFYKRKQIVFGFYELKQIIFGFHELKI